MFRAWPENKCEGWRGKVIYFVKDHPNISKIASLLFLPKDYKIRPAGADDWGLHPQTPVCEIHHCKADKFQTLNPGWAPVFQLFVLMTNLSLFRWNMLDLLPAFCRKTGFPPTLGPWALHHINPALFATSHIAIFLLSLTVLWMLFYLQVRIDYALGPALF